MSATYPANAKPGLTLISQVSLKNYAVDLSATGRAPHVSKEELDYFLKPTRYGPTDAIVAIHRASVPLYSLLRLTGHYRATGAL